VNKKPAPEFDENRIVHWLLKRFGAGGASLIKGIGDDAAVLRARGAADCLIITTDMLLEDVDFRRGWLTPSQLGHKSLAVNLSDLAAMGARPRFFMVALALPPDITQNWIQAFYAGIARLARLHRATLIGGDLSRSPSGIQITITAFGEASPKHVVYRSGGHPGDLLYVTGVLGRAGAGLALLRQGRNTGRNNAEHSALRAQRTPEPRCETGVWLAQSGLANCMMDLSDGLSMDLPRLCAASGTGAAIYGDRIPVFAAARAWHCDPEELSLHGGEDFELLFAVSPARAATLDAAYPASLPRIHCIGRLLRKRGVFWSPGRNGPLRPLIASGFDHFASRPPISRGPK
jgi:thiamine-monophosphate kinase